MSFKIVEQAKPRLNRSELAVPGSNPSLFEKAAKSNVDVIFLDLEDAVAPDEKEQARKNIIEGLNDIDWNTYLGNQSRSHFSELKQIHAGNINLLEFILVLHF